MVILMIEVPFVKDELPELAPVGMALAVVTNVEPLPSVVVMRTPPETRGPMVEVMLFPAVSLAVATKIVLVPEGVETVAVTDLVEAPEAVVAVAIETTEDAAARASVEM